MILQVSSEFCLTTSAFAVLGITMMVLLPSALFVTILVKSAMKLSITLAPVVSMTAIEYSFLDSVCL